MRSSNKPLWSMMKSGLAYGLGLTVGFLITQLLYRSVSPDLFRTGNEVVRLVLGVILLRRSSMSGFQPSSSIDLKNTAFPSWLATLL